MGYDLSLHNIGNKIEGLTDPIFNRNIFGLLMGMGVIVSFLSIKFTSKIILKILLVTLLVLFIFTTLFTYSRAVWVALIASFLAYIIVNIRNFNKFGWLNTKNPTFSSISFLPYYRYKYK